MSKWLGSTRYRRFTAGCAAGLTLFVALGSARSEELRRFTATEMLDIVEVADGSAALSSDGDLLAFVHPDVDDERNVLGRHPVGYIRILDLSGTGTAGERGRMIQLGQGSVHASFPSWSPDGRRLAYFIEDSSGTRLALWDRESGDSKRIGTGFPGEPYLAPQWDPSGGHIVFASTADSGSDYDQTFLPPPTFASAAREYGPDEFPRVVVLDSTDETIPGDSAFIERTRAHLIAVDLSSGRERQLNEESVHLRHFKVSPGKPYVIFSAPTKESFGLVGRETLETFLVPLNGSEAPHSLTTDGERLDWSPKGNELFYLKDGDLNSVDLSGERARVFSDTKFDSENLFIEDFSWSPNGRWLAALVTDESFRDPEIEPPQTEMYTIANPLTNIYVADGRNGDVHEISTDAAATIDSGDLAWASDGSRFFFKGTDQEAYDDYIYGYELRTEELRRLTQGKESIGKIRSSGDTLLFTAQTAQRPADFYSIHTDNGSRRRVTNLNPQLSGFRFSDPELFQFINGDGERMGALLYRPVDVDPSENVPVITYVYEKLTPRRYRFSARHQIFLNHGFAVLMPNVKINVGEPGTSFVKSVVPATNAVRSMGFTNGKFSIWGGSFGAYATSYIITQTDTFACAVARATPPELFNNWASGRDRDSRNIERGQARIGGNPYEMMERYLSQSAFFHLDKVKTPVLIMHGAQDRTILFDEGEMFFYALRQLGKEAKFVAYTYGDHSLYRHSRTDAIDVHRRLLDWFNNCLK